MGPRSRDRGDDKDREAGKKGSGDGGNKGAGDVGGAWRGARGGCLYAGDLRDGDSGWVERGLRGDVDFKGLAGRWKSCLTWRAPGKGPRIHGWAEARQIGADFVLPGDPQDRCTASQGEFPVAAGSWLRRAR